MKRLILIGNGYDLALGLKTSYENFLVDYFKEALNIVVTKLLEEGENYTYDDDLISVSSGFEYLNKGTIDGKLSKIDNIDKLLDQKMIRFVHLMSEEKWIKKFNIIEFPTYRFDINVKSKFLQKLLGDYNWKDIESFYFGELLRIFNGEEIENRKKVTTTTEHYGVSRKERAEELNTEFNAIKIALAKYIGKISQSMHIQSSEKPLKPLQYLLKSLGKETFSRFFDGKETSNAVSKCLIVNFNYTPTIGIHSIMNTKENKYEIINIHGTYDKPDDIIFGYGDDSHPEYSKIEQSAEDEYLKHIKSFYYPLNKHYIHLMNFIESDQYEVQVIGHSLGLSDRVLLKSIFENQNCKCIKLYHRGKRRNMIHKYMALSRHFSNKASMRRKVYEFDKNDTIYENEE